MWQRVQQEEGSRGPVQWDSEEFPQDVPEVGPATSTAGGWASADSAPRDRRQADRRSRDFDSRGALLQPVSFDSVQSKAIGLCRTPQRCRLGCFMGMLGCLNALNRPIMSRLRLSHGSLSAIAEQSCG